MRLQDRVCVIMGGAGGIGRGIAGVFAREGATIALVDRDADRLALAAAELPDGAAVSTHVADLASGADVASTVNAVVANHHRIHALVNAHGVTDVSDTNITEVADDLFDDIYALNVRSVFLTCKHVIPVMREGEGGSVVNIASTAALVGWGGAAYTAAKGAVAALSRHIAYQEAANGIRCNTILPGIIDTPMLATVKVKEGMVPPPPLLGQIARRGRPEEVGYLATFLASDESQFVTSATYTIDGGVTRH